MTPAIQLQRLAHRWPGADQPALRGVDMIVQSGERVGLVGPNGAGKSTLLAFLNGSLLASPPVLIDGLPVDRKQLHAVRRKVGVVQQETEDQLFMPTVEEDVAFGPLNAGLDAQAVSARVRDALQRVGALHLIDRPVHNLSGGERRRVAIATVLSMDVSLLCLDEPTSNLDARGRRAMATLLRGLRPTLVVATHDLALVGAVCERVVVLDDGRVVADGPVASVLADPALLERHGVA